ncbi:drug/Metabolite transporter superfamily protein [Thecamonas trahens ATCC 50062]|uniref:Drug/Metabolite transporter superfamily protein n=1 Tax=Thecamonas trahens ATCC 50062 TaxID=461836 RepID=A0A0L0D9T2_THETB|nr:drug/Metabolite transporter superfamily protein [Thecamonas trahens ATCC 50062]KNC49010.1 drug/Metabolite transporter superfamily protein [Thecamonas trahens ATCC 50062]|eukprot:XP_013758421.1 drug/Metabolite transporter superfamily protein [Thecamonas trahens ATCC 50062]
MSGSSTGDIESRLGIPSQPKGKMAANTTVAAAPLSPARVALLCLGSIASSVSLILVNKSLMQYFGFRYVFTLTFLHLTVTAVLLRIVANVFGWFELRTLPLNVSLSIAAFGVGSIGLMNLSMYSNSLGTYQLFKLLCVPAILVLKFVKTGETISRKITVALLILLTGVGIATVTDVQISSTGIMYGLAATIATAQFQIYQGSCQSEYGVTSVQATAAITPYQSVLTLLVALMVEVPGEDSVLNFRLTAPAFILIVLSCLGAIAVNLVSFALIGKTSPVTYQVVGHLKTILVLTFGFLFFTQVESAEGAAKNLLGVAVAMAGVILYGHLKIKIANGERDILDNCM